MTMQTAAADCLAGRERKAAAGMRLRLVRCTSAARRSGGTRRAALDLAIAASAVSIAVGLFAAMPLAGELPRSPAFDLSRLWISVGLPPLG